MKTIPAGLLAHYQSGSTTLAWGIKLTRADGEVFGWTSADRDATISAVLYRSAPGLDVASFVTSAGLAVDNSEITLLRIEPDETIVTKLDILAGRWDNARYSLFRYNWDDDTDDIDIISVGRLGQLQAREGVYVAELRGPQQPVQQPVGVLSTKTCRARLGDSMCGVDLAGSPSSFTRTGSVTSVASKQEFTDAARAEDDDFFGEGILTWKTGLNANLSQKIKTYESDTFTLSLPMIMAVQVGDTYSAVAGCRKRLAEDCIAKFDNVLNFQGEPHRPTMDDLTSQPQVDA